MFRPKANQEIRLSGKIYYFQEHPSAPGYAFGQEGRAATVYQLKGPEQLALKVFKPQHRVPGLTGLSHRTKDWATHRGLRVCNRWVVTPGNEEKLLQAERDLTYAVVMPWIDGPNWMEIVAEKRMLSRSALQFLARRLAEALTSMEQDGLAHCDLSAANLLLPELVEPGAGVELVDIEQIFGPGLERPEILTSGSPGYAPSLPEEQFWGRAADRFAGGLLLAEMIGWFDERVRELSGLESYFEPEELQQDNDKYRLLSSVLATTWGQESRQLLDKLWHARSLDQCPLFADWLLVLPKIEAIPRVELTLPPNSPTVPPPEPLATTREISILQGQLELASKLELEGKVGQALSAYRRVQRLSGDGTALHSELAIIIQELEKEAAVGSSSVENHSVPVSPAAGVPTMRTSAPFPWGRVFATMLGLAVVGGGVYFGYEAWLHRSGQLSIAANSPDMEVVIDGVSRGQALVSGANSNLMAELPPGEHTVEVKRKDFYSAPQTLNLQPGGESKLTFDVQPVLVNVTLRLKPSPQDLSVGGTPFKGASDGQILNLRPGRYDVVGNRTSYKSNHANVEVVAGRAAHVSLELSPSLHSLTVLASKDPAKVTIFDSHGVQIRQGLTKGGKFSLDLESGQYKVKVMKAGYIDWSRPVAIGPDDGKRALLAELKEIPVAAPVYTASEPVYQPVHHQPYVPSHPTSDPGGEEVH